MALNRKHQKIFAKNAVGTDLGIVGSKNQDNPQYSSDIEQLQNLSNWEIGLRAQVTSNKAPYLQDQNSIFYVITSQLAYLFQAGVPEWNAQTEYFADRSIVQKNGKIYIAIADSTNVEPEVTNNWRQSWKSIWDIIAVGGGLSGYCPSESTSSGKAITLNYQFIDDINNIPEGLKLRIKFNNGSNSSSSSLVVYDKNGQYRTFRVTINNYQLLYDSSYMQKFYALPNEIVEFSLVPSQNGLGEWVAVCDNRIVEVQSYSVYNNNSFYRVYRDGWLEQGGRVANISTSVNDYVTISFPKKFKDTNYQVLTGVWGGKMQSGANNMALGVTDATTDDIKVIMYAIDQNASMISWKTEGYIK